jgi:hypothetical protein
MNCITGNHNRMDYLNSVRSLFSFPGFVAVNRLTGIFSDQYARVIKLRRRKLLSVRAVASDLPMYIGKLWQEMPNKRYCLYGAPASASSDGKMI